MLRLFLLVLPISLSQVPSPGLVMFSPSSFQAVHFFGPPAIGFGVGLVSVHRYIVFLPLKIPVSIILPILRGSLSPSSYDQEVPGGYLYSEQEVLQVLQGY